MVSLRRIIELLQNRQHHFDHIELANLELAARERRQRDEDDYARHMQDRELGRPRFQ